MVISCVVFGCTNRSGRDKKRFFRFPAIIKGQGTETFEISTERRRLWLKAIHRKNFKPSPYSRVCSDHFINGEPAKLFQRNFPNWTPTLKVGYNHLSTPSSSTNLERFIRLRNRNHMKNINSLIGAERPQGLVMETETSLQSASSSSDVQRTTLDIAAAMSYNDEEDFPSASPQEVAAVVSCSSPMTSSTCQCAELSEQLRQADEKLQKQERHIKELEDEVHKLKEELAGAKKQICNFALTEDTFREDDEKVNFYTGLPTSELLFTVFGLLKDDVPGHQKKCSLTYFQQFVMVLMRLRLNLTQQDLAYRFNVHRSTISRTVRKWIELMFKKLTPALIKWPNREELRLTMPMIFRKSFPRCVVIIDGFEIFINRAHNLEARATTYSHYKSHNTVKYLIGIAPQGVVTFISTGFGGRADDEFIVEQSGILDHFIPGDQVLADRGFKIHESVGLRCAELVIPAFTRGKKQLHPVEVESTRELASCRIHVERVIGQLKLKYSILQGPIHVDLLESQTEEEFALIDKIVRVCCALINCCPSVVPFD